MRQSPLREESLGAQGRLGVQGGRLEGMTGWVEQRGRGCEAARYRRAALGGSSSGRASGVAEGGKRARPLDARQQPPPGASSALHHGGGPAGHAHRSPRANHRAALPPPVLSLLPSRSSPPSLLLPLRPPAPSPRSARPPLAGLERGPPPPTRLFVMVGATCRRLRQSRGPASRRPQPLRGRRRPRGVRGGGGGGRARGL